MAILHPGDERAGTSVFVERDQPGLGTGSSRKLEWGHHVHPLWPSLRLYGLHCSVADFMRFCSVKSQMLIAAHLHFLDLPPVVCRPNNENF